MQDLTGPKAKWRKKKIAWLSFRKKVQPSLVYPNLRVSMPHAYVLGCGDGGKIGEHSVDSQGEIELVGPSLHQRSPCPLDFSGYVKKWCPWGSLWTGIWSIQIKGPPL